MSRIPLANARGSEVLVPSRDRERAVGKIYLERHARQEFTPKSRIENPKWLGAFQLSISLHHLLPTVPWKADGEFGVPTITFVINDGTKAVLRMPHP